MKKSQSKPFVLVDGSSYLYRAFHAMPYLSNSKGFPTGAIYGVINMLRRLLLDYDPELIAVVFDTRGKTFRDDLYDKYKANRKEMPDDLTPQIEPIHEIIRAMGIHLIAIPGVEADDVIGTLAKQAEQNKVDTLISTGDKDFAQLVDEHITLINTMSNYILNPTTVVEKFGIPPNLIIDYLTLVGDTVDNIPGVPKVGPKTAVKWLNEYGSLDNIVANADNISGKVGENLRSSIDQLPLSKLLATIKIDVPLDLPFTDLKRGLPQIEKLKQLYQEYEFKNWLNELLQQNPEQNEHVHEKYLVINTPEKLDEWLQKLTQSEFIALHLATDLAPHLDAEIIGLSFAIEPGKAAYIPLSHAGLANINQLNREQVLLKLKPILENPQIKKIGHDLKYVLQVLDRHNIQLQGDLHDTMLQSYILDSSTNNHEINTLAIKHLGWRVIPYEEIAGKGAKQLSFDETSIEKATDFAAEITDVALHLHQNLFPKLQAEKGLHSIFTNIEIPLLHVLAKMEQNGVLIDTQKLAKHNDELERRLLELEIAIYQLADEKFNINSPKQLQEILFDKLKIPVLQKTPTGQPSTAEPVLQELALEFELPKIIMEYRGLSKLITTYTKRLPEVVHPKTGRIHTSYNQTGAATGRLSSSEPNLQNIPIRSVEGKKIRESFVAAPGYKIICADYSQIELRIMAHISKDPGLLKAFEQNLDVHEATASEVFDVPLEKISAEDRRRAKAINFGLIYGMSAFGLAKRIDVSRDAAQQYINKYFERYPLVRKYMENAREHAHSQGYVETLWGRRLYVPDINSSQIQRQRAAERAAINAPLQGSAADIIKRAMISLHQWLENNNIDAKMIMQVHDELVFEVAEKDVEKMTQVIREHMMQAAELNVPLLVSIGSGNNWDEAAMGSSLS